jgi:hypothetical protein
VISESGVATCPNKIKVVMDWRQPYSVKEVQSFLGLAGYYRWFVKHYGIIARPLTDLLKKNIVFQWTSDQDTAFQILKRALTNAPILALLDFSKPFIVETDTSRFGVGADLMQNHHPLAFISKPLGPKMRGLSTYEKEYIAILLAVEQWKAYLQHNEFHIYTDQKSLVHLNDQRLNTVWQQKVFTKLLGLNYRIIYKKGIENGAADALSKNPTDQVSCLAMSTCQPQWLQHLLDSYAINEQTRVLISKVTLDTSVVPHFTWHQGILRYKGRIWVASDPELQGKLIAVFHDSALGGHSGIPVTYRKLKQIFAWKSMKTAVHDYVKSCMICQQAKPD